ncbi:carbohydrate ABC transporter permease [Herbidospora sp. NBRC 101105]|uniref:carbohydrate ABC transporter permease n=1 Tax=Herbidospora sp. NBRC 101105 TaxID=3032195 RepID=UPI00249FDB94|nr:carbohydrate ABC transporter permease [Herbidospora sp. NBRC 101105]GLX95168.1 binding-protein-dependent transport system inner membrane protein [Herbidospora sp. NBRC 101105]
MRRRDWWVVGSYAVVGLFLLWVLVPIVTVALNSVKSPQDIFSSSPTLSFTPTGDNYGKVLGELSFQTFLVNSTIVALGSTLLSVVVGVPAAYALARLPVRGREWWAWLILFTRMVPAVALVVPMFVIFQRLQLLGTYTALVAAHTTFNLPIVIWMMRSFFEELPRDLEEAAQVDGTGRFGAFLRVALPLTSPGLAATGVLCLLFSWNEFLFALVLSGRETQTTPIGVASFIGTVSVDWGGSSAAAVLAMIPVFVLGLAAQRFLVRGLTFGAVKG